MLLLSMVTKFTKLGKYKKNSLTEASLGWSCLGRYLKELSSIHTGKQIC